MTLTSWCPKIDHHCACDINNPPTKLLKITISMYLYIYIFIYFKYIVYCA